MKLIIDIPEELKNKIDNANEDNYRTYIWWFETTLYCAIKNGTILPKGHGRLIDADKFQTDYYFERRYGYDFYKDFQSRVKSQLTIVEADKEN